MGARSVWEEQHPAGALANVLVLCINMGEQPPVPTICHGS